MTERKTQVQMQFAPHVLLGCYAAAFWLAQPTLPFLFKELGIDSGRFGLFQSAFSLLQALGGPLVGRIIDRHGAKSALLLSHLSAALGYFSLAYAGDFSSLLLSQVFSLLQHPTHASQTLVSLTSIASGLDPSQRSNRLAQLSVAYGIGMTLGPSLGGLLNRYISYSSVAFLAGLVSLVNLALTYFFVQHSLPTISQEIDPASTSTSSSSSSNQGFTLAPVFEILKTMTVRRLVIASFFVSTATSLARSSMMLFMRDTLLLPAEVHGYVMSGIGILAVLVNIFGIKLFVSFSGEHAVLRISSAMLAFLFFVYALIPPVLVTLLGVLSLLVLFGLCFSTVMTSFITSRVDVSLYGTVIGLNMCLSALARTVTPFMGGYLHEVSPISAPLLSCGLALTGFLLIPSFHHKSD